MSASDTLSARTRIMARIFISHSSHDNATAGDLLNRLLGWGFRPEDVFLDYDADSGIPAGVSWERHLVTHLKDARVVLCLLSRSWLRSEWCRAEYHTALLSGKTLISIVIDDCDHSAFAASVQKIVVSGDSDAAFAKLEHGLAEAGYHPLRPLFRYDAQRGPFPGLRAFEESDAAVFFGREVEVEDLLGHLNAMRTDPTRARLALIVGGSGSGKSSVMRAGVVPRLRRRAGWELVGPLRLGSSPTLALAEAVHAAPPSAPTLGVLAARTGAMAGSPDLVAWQAVLADRPAGASPAEDVGATCLLVIDQFEELFASLGAAADEAQRVLAALLQPGGRVLALATLRSSGLAAFQASPLAASTPTSIYSLGPLPSQDLATVIRRPCEVAEVRFEEALVRRAATDTGGGDALPLLAVALERLWRIRGAQDGLTLKAYLDHGGIAGAIGGAVRAAQESLHASEAEMVEVIVPRLADADAAGHPLRRRATVAEFTGAGERRIVQALADARLLVLDQPGIGLPEVAPGGRNAQRAADVAWVEVAHEALFRQWAAVRERLDARFADLRLLSRIERDAVEWTQALGDRPDRAAAAGASALIRLSGPELRRALALLHSDAGARPRMTGAAAYVAAAVALRRRRLAVRSAVALSTALLAFYGAGTFAIMEDARAHLGTAAEAQRLFDKGALALAAVRPPGSAYRWGWPEEEALDYLKRAGFERWVGHARDAGSFVRSLAVSPRDALVGKGHADGRVTVTRPGGNAEKLEICSAGSTVTAMAFSRDGRFVATGSADGHSAICLLDGSQAPLVLDERNRRIVGVAFTRDAGHLVTASSDGRARAWQLPQGKLAVVLDGHDDALTDVDASADGRWLVTGALDGRVVLRDANPPFERRSTLVLGEGGVVSARLSADGSTLLTATRKGPPRLWSIVNGRAVQPRTLGGRATPALLARFSPDGSLIASAHENQTLRLWRASDAQQLADIAGHDATISDVVFAPDSRTVFSASYDQFTREWSVETPPAVPLDAQAVRRRMCELAPNMAPLEADTALRPCRPWGPWQVKAPR